MSSLASFIMDEFFSAASIMSNSLWTLLECRWLGAYSWRPNSGSEDSNSQGKYYRNNFKFRLPYATYNSSTVPGISLFCLFFGNDVMSSEHRKKCELQETRKLLGYLLLEFHSLWMSQCFAGEVQYTFLSLLIYASFNIWTCLSLDIVSTGIFKLLEK